MSDVPCRIRLFIHAWIPGVVSLGASFAATLLFGQVSPSEIRIEQVTGEMESRGALISATAAHLTFSSGNPCVPNDLRWLRFHEPVTESDSPTPRAILHLTGSGRLPVKEVVLIDDAVMATLPDGREIKVGLDDLVALQFGDGLEPAWTEALSHPAKEHDLVIVGSGRQVTSIRAFLEAISAESIEFDWEKQTRSVSRAQVIGVVFARAEGAGDGEAKYLVEMTGGGSVRCQEIHASDDRKSLRLVVSETTNLDFPVTSVEAVEVASSRLTFVSNLVPVEIRERPIVALPRSWQKNRNVRGEPLRAGSQLYDNGIGVQSGSVLVYELDGQAQQFAAVLALDPPGGKGGDCEFVILADDRELVRYPLRGGDTPVPVRVKVAGARRLELRVDYGRDLDFGDHANWCDAHIVKASLFQSAKE